MHRYHLFTHIFTFNSDIFTPLTAAAGLAAGFELFSSLPPKRDSRLEGGIIEPIIDKTVKGYEILVNKRKLYSK